jgi:hypothetical protein
MATVVAPAPGEQLVTPMALAETPDTSPTARNQWTSE